MPPTADTFVKLADHAAGKDDRWLMLALLILLIVGMAWMVWTLSKRLTAITDRHIAQGERMSEVVANNTKALETNTHVLSRCKWKSGDTTTALALLLALGCWCFTPPALAAEQEVIWDQATNVWNYTLNHGVVGKKGTNQISLFAANNTAFFPVVLGVTNFVFVNYVTVDNLLSSNSNVILIFYPSSTVTNRLLPALRLRLGTYKP